MTSAARPKLSFCTVTDDPIATARTVADLRAIADEIIVAVDERAADENDVLTDVDRLFIVEYRPPPERILPWVHAQCTGRWRLRLDADEVPSAAFLAALPDLIEADDVTHYYISRRWLYGDPDSFLSIAPWYPDFQLRLVRNDPSVDAPPSKVHELPTIDGARRFVDEGVYDLDLLVNSYEVRRRRASEYERVRPGVRSEGLGVNAGYYLPEGRAVETAPVPAEDRDGIARRLSPSPRTPSSGRARAEHVGQSAYEELWPERSLPPSAYRARVESYAPPATITAAQDRRVFVRVTNDGTITLPRGAMSRPEIRLAYRFRASDDSIIEDGTRTPFPAQVLAGESALVPVVVHAPTEPGEYTLEVDVVHEHVRWFDSVCRIPITVVLPRRLLIVAGYSPFRHVGEDAIVRAHLHRLAMTAPDVQPVLLAPDPVPIANRFGHRAEPDIRRLLYDGTDPTGDRNDVLDRVFERIDDLVADATRVRAGTPSTDARRQRFFDLVAGSDAVVFTGGGAHASRSAVAELWPRMATALVAQALGRRVVFSGVTVGPIHDPADRELVRRAMDAAELIVVRDRGASARALSACGVEHVRVIEDGDPAIALEPAPDWEVEPWLAAVGVPLGHPFVAVSLRATSGRAYDFAALAALLDHLWRYYRCRVVLIPHCLTGPNDDDRESMEKLRGLVDAEVPVHALDPLPPDDVIKGVIARAALAVGARYHLAILAASSGIPAIGLFDDDDAEQKLRGAAEFDPALVAVVGVDTTIDPLIAVANKLMRVSSARVKPAPAMTCELRALNHLLS
jgi:polysaccharide pyruvyl transferase WcaK-like protein